MHVDRLLRAAAHRTGLGTREQVACDIPLGVRLHAADAIACYPTTGSAAPRTTTSAIDVLFAIVDSCVDVLITPRNG